MEQCSKQRSVLLATVQICLNQFSTVQRCENPKDAEIIEFMLLTVVRWVIDRPPTPGRLSHHLALLSPQQKSKKNKQIMIRYSLWFTSCRGSMGLIEASGNFLQSVNWKNDYSCTIKNRMGHNFHSNLQQIIRRVYQLVSPCVHLHPYEISLIPIYWWLIIPVWCQGGWNP